jgi:hypothetical protein
VVVAVLRLDGLADAIALLVALTDFEAAGLLRGLERTGTSVFDFASAVLDDGFVALLFLLDAK